MTRDIDNRRGRRAAAASVSPNSAAPPEAAGAAPPRLPLVATAAGVATAVFVLYMASLAPGLTWAHDGADGGELLAAAMTNGVPHPPGYPLYILLLRGWLGALQWVSPASDLAWRGNLLSALAAAVAVALTVATIPAVLPVTSRRLLWAAMGGLALGLSPLLWSQAIITEVYALHMLFVALLGWATLIGARRALWWLAVPVALGVAHHLTLLLLLPATLYYVWRDGVWGDGKNTRRATAAILWMGLGMAVGALIYLRIPLAARQIPPINWGYADSWEGFWWLVSGAAYRANLFATPPSSILQQLGAMGVTLVRQLTPVGLIVAIIGLAAWDQQQPRLRNFALLWITPISIYAIGYYTRDSYIYLLPVTWMLTLWLAAGLAQVEAWLQPRGGRRVAPAVAALCVAGLAAATAFNWPSVALRNDHAATDFVRAAATVLEPDSIVISRSDAETFGLWYGTWADGTLEQAAPNLLPVNDALYQFVWYKRLQNDLNPDVAGVGESIDALIAGNAGQRPIYFAEELPIVPAVMLEETPPLWRYLPGD
jgi:hypothetical protein